MHKISSCADLHHYKGPIPLLSPQLIGDSPVVPKASSRLACDQEFVFGSILLVYESNATLVDVFLISEDELQNWKLRLIFSNQCRNGDPLQFGLRRVEDDS